MGCILIIILLKINPVYCPFKLCIFASTEIKICNFNVSISIVFMLLSSFIWPKTSADMTPAEFQYFNV